MLNKNVKIKILKLLTPIILCSL